MATTTTKTKSSSSSSSSHHADSTPVTKKTTTSYVTSTPVTKTTVHRTVGGVTTSSTSESVGESKTTSSSYTTEHGGSTKSITEGVPTTTTATYTTEQHTLGGTRSSGISQESALVLEKALQDEANYSKKVTVRIRVFEIRSVTKQVVSGTNYRYEVVGARESATNGAEITSAHATKAVYAITVYEQTWTNTLQVTGIELLNKDVNAPIDVPAPATGGYGAVAGSAAHGSAAAGAGTKKVTSFLASIDSWFS